MESWKLESKDGGRQIRAAFNNVTQNYDLNKIHKNCGYFGKIHNTVFQEAGKLGPKNVKNQTFAPVIIISTQKPEQAVT